MKDDIIKISRSMLNKLYTTGYAEGHNDTVESCYTDVLPVDAGTYFEDVVGDWLSDHLEDTP